MAQIINENISKIEISIKKDDEFVKDVSKFVDELLLP
jgi:methyl-accepting chemotaxis protein